MKLSNRISIYVLGVCLVIGLGLTFVLERTVARNQRMQVERVITMFQHQLVERFKTDLRDVERQVKRSALELELSEGVNERDAGRLLRVMIESDTLIMGGSVALNPSLAASGQKEWMLYVARDSVGDFSRKVLGSPDYPYTTMDWFRKPIDLRKACWSSVYMDAGAGGTSMITYSMPLFGGRGEIYAVVTADISTDQLAESVSALKPYKDSESFLVDSAGKIILPGSPFDGCTAEKVCGGADRIVTSTPIGVFPMSIVTVTPADSLMSVLSGLRVHFILIMLFGLIVLVITIKTLMNRMSQPLDRLSEVADSIGRGNFQTPLPDVGRYTDLNRLRGAMQRMEMSISDYVDMTARNARERERIDSELKFAADIQRSMLPADPPSALLRAGGSDLALATLLCPALDVSGDLYFWQAEGSKLWVAIADVSGKGIPASLLMVALKERLSADVENGLSPDQILSDLNNALCRNNPRNMFVTMQVAVFDSDTLTVTIANAGHNLPVCRHDGVWNLMSLAPGLPIGIMADMEYTATTLRTVPGDAIFIYTDGLTEAENRDKVQFGEDRLLDLLAATDPLAAADRPVAIASRIMEFAPDDSHDDMTMVLSILEADTRKTLVGRRRECIADAIRFAAECAARWHLGEGPAYSLNLIVEEWITNIVEYTSDADASESPVEMSASFNGRTVELVISYAAPEFDPLADAPQVDTSASAESRPVGGLGIFMIRQLSSEIAHSYNNGINTLNIKIETTSHVI